MTWLAAHLPWLVWMLLVIWAPPVLYTLAIDLHWIEAPASGYPTLTDPALLASTLQIGLMLAALPGMAARRPRSWNLLAAAVLAWLAHFSWTTISRFRLDGARGLQTLDTLWPLAGVIAAVTVLSVVRPYFSNGASPALQ